MIPFVNNTPQIGPTLEDGSFTPANTTTWEKFLTGFEGFTGALGNLGLSINFPNGWGGINPYPSGYRNPGGFPDAPKQDYTWLWIVLVILVVLIVLYFLFKK